jgi:uroporphyrin-III C-methyltransferase/precorrin-2 dehydrogenase/sirohydrochlorin ferrochelatase
MPEASPPSAGRTAAIAPIAVLPIFFKLWGRDVLLVGNSAAAAWKAELLAAAGAHLRIIASEPGTELEACCEALRPFVDLQRRDWQIHDFKGAALAIGALEGEAAEAFHAAAKNAGVPVNVIDVPRFCDFQFGTIIGRSPLVIGISTDGAAPVFGQALRARMEALLPATIGLWAEAAKAWRPALQDLELGFAARRRFWESFADQALGGEAVPSEEVRAACLAAAIETQAAPQGRLILVGVGPGEADLLTLRAVRALQSAEVIVYDRGLPPALLALGRREAVRRAQSGDDQDTIGAISADLRSGKILVWVGPGDPRHCARWVLKRQALAAGGLSPAQIVAGLACGSCLPGCTATQDDKSFI